MKFVVTLSTLNAGHFQDGAEWVWQPPSIKLVTRDAPNISPPSTRRPKFRDEFPKAHSKEREFLFPILGDNIFILPHSMKSASRVLRRMLLFIPLAVLGGILQKTADAQSHNVDGTFLVDARVDGSPAVLLLDTGAEHCLLDREFAKRLGLHPIADANVQKPYSSGKNETVRVSDLEIQSIHSSDLNVMTDDLTASSGALGVRIDGVLGNDFLRKFTVTLDYSVGSITFDHISVSHHGVPINLGRVGNRYLVHLNFDGVLLSFLLDTGTNFSALSQSGWARLNQDKTVLPLIDGVRSSGTSATSKLVCIQRVTLGRNSYQNLPVRVQPPMSAGIFANPAVDGLLGSDFLMQFVVSLDLANNALYLNPDRNFTADRDRFSTIGIQFAKDPTGFFTVMAVWRPTPASEANIKVGDQILSVNGLNTIEMSQEDLSRQLHGEPGRKIQVTIRSGGDQRTLNLIIRNLLCQSPSLIVTR
jgi:predicted aspartyl protease